MCHRTESMNVLSAGFISYNTSFFRYWNRKGEDDIYVCLKEKAHQHWSLLNGSIWTPPPLPALFLQFATVLLHTGLPLEQMWSSTVVWPLRYTSCYIDVRWHVSAIYKNEYCSFFILSTSEPPPPPQHYHHHQKKS